jgi:hypothetical protein
MACSSPRQYVIVLPLTAAVTAILYNRTDAGVADTAQSSGKNFLSIVVPTTKQAGTENPVSGRVAIFWTESDETPTFADLVSLGEFGRGSTASIPLADFNEGYFWACALGGSAIEVHCTETRK